MNRRNLLKAMAASGVGAVAYRPAAAHPREQMSDELTFNKIEEIARNVFFAEGRVSFFEDGNFREAQCNNGFVIFDKFVLVIDSNFPAPASVLLREIRKRTDKPIKHVFNTHHHGDHLYGNHYWTQNGALSIGHVGLIDELKKYETGYFGNLPGRWEMAQKNRKDLDGATLTPPTLVFDRNMVLEDKGMRVELLHIGKGHTLGDAIAWLPTQRVLFAGDSCLTGPYNLLRDAHVGSWIQTLGKMAKLSPDIVLPGHGIRGTAASPEEQRSYLKYVFDWVTHEKQRTKNWIEIESKISTLRDEIKNHYTASQYLIQEPSVVPGFSLTAHAKRIFDELT